MCKKALLCLVAILLPLELQAKIDLVTLPVRDQVQLTIYNAADLTLVREQRTLTLKQGINRLEFSWAETLIDPTSVYLDAPQHAGKVNLLEVAYPPNVKGSAIWTIESQVAGTVPVEITFFTSGISWRAFYTCTLSTDEKTMRLQNYVRVDNRSGEDYLNAETRVVVGKIHLLDRIAKLAQRHPPYGMPISIMPPSPRKTTRQKYPIGLRKARSVGAMSGMSMKAMGAPARKKIIKEGLSEYFLYSIEGTESIRNAWGKRLISLNIAKIPVRALYRYDEHRYGKQVRRLLFFKNDKKHQLGETPLPDGKVMIYRQLADKHLSYVAATKTKYIPVKQEVELSLGAARSVKVKPVLMNYRTENYVFDFKGNISGYDQIQTWQLKLENNRDLPVDIEIFQHFPNSYWKIKNPKKLHGNYKKVDLDTIKYRLTLPARTKEYLLNYTLTLFEGERRQKQRTSP